MFRIYVTLHFLAVTVVIDSVAHAKLIIRELRRNCFNYIRKIGPYYMKFMQTFEMKQIRGTCALILTQMCVLLRIISIPRV